MSRMSTAAGPPFKRPTVCNSPLTLITQSSPAVHLTLRQVMPMPCWPLQGGQCQAAGCNQHGAGGMAELQYFLCWYGWAGGEWRGWRAAAASRLARAPALACGWLPAAWGGHKCAKQAQGPRLDGGATGPQCATRPQRSADTPTAGRDNKLLTSPCLSSQARLQPGREASGGATLLSTLKR